MSLAPTCKAQLLLDFKNQNTFVDGVVRGETGKPDYGYNFLNGTGLGKISKIYRLSDYSIAASPLVLDLVSGGLLDVLGAALSFSKLRLLVIRNQDATNILTVGAGTAPVPLFADPASDQIDIKPLGTLVITAPAAAGIAVTSSTADKITIDPGANTILADIFLAGE